MISRVLTLVAVVLMTSCASVETVAPTTHPEEAAVRATVAEIYTIVSGERGAPRRWERLKELFLPIGYLAISSTARDGSTRSRSFSVDEFIKGASSNSMRDGFYESPIVTKVEIFGGVATAFSSYASRRTPDGKPFARGVNALTLVKTSHGWQICVIAWSEESSGVALPDALSVSPR